MNYMLVKNTLKL